MPDKNLETMTHILRAHAPSPSLLRNSERTALGALRPSRAPRLLLATGTLAALVGAALSLRPQPAAAKGLTWTQIARATADAGVRHGVETEPRGFSRTEFWTDGTKWAEVHTLTVKEGTMLDGRRRKAEQAVIEYRNNGVRGFSGTFGSDGGPTPERPNRSNVGYIATIRTPRVWRDEGHLYPGGRDSLAVLLAEKDARVLDEKRIGGRREVRVRLDDPLANRGVRTGTIVVDEKGRVVEARGFGLFPGTVSRYDYPASVPQSVFEPRPQIFPAIAVDFPKMRESVARGVARGLGTDRGITLRAVLLDCVGSLYVLYSGAVPPGSLPRSVGVVGVPCSKPYGMKTFVAGAPKPAVVDGVRLGGMAVTPLRKIGSRVTLRVPAARGEAVFRDVPVQRCVWVADLRDELGIPRGGL